MGVRLMMWNICNLYSNLAVSFWLHGWVSQEVHAVCGMFMYFFTIISVFNVQGAQRYVHYSNITQTSVLSTKNIVLCRVVSCCVVSGISWS